VTLSDEIKSNHFDIVYGTNFKVVTNFYAGEQYVLTHCGTTAPTAAEVDALAPLPEKSKGGAMTPDSGFVRKSFTVPIKSFGDETGTTHGYVDALGVVDRIAYMSSGAVSACMQKALVCDATMLQSNDWREDLQTDGNQTLKNSDNAAWVEAFQTPRTTAQLENVDVYFVDKSGDAAHFGTDAGSAKTVAFTASWDPDMLHIAEWIKFIAAFFNLEDKAEAHFKKVSETWNGGTALDKKVVIINKPYKIHLTPYKVSWIEAAGAKTYTKEELTAGTGTIAKNWQGIETCDPTTTSSCDIEFDASDTDAVAEWKSFVEAADVIIDDNSPWPADTENAYGTSHFTTQYGDEMSALTAKVYRTDGILKALGGSTDWYEGRYANPDWLCEDLRAVLKGETRDRIHLRKLVGESPKIRTPSACDTTLPACDSSAEISVIDAPCETYKTCVTVDDIKSSAPAMAAAALLLLPEL
jgi:hypothetical protein